MAESNATDLRVQKTQDAIQTAIKEMICEMDAADITVGRNLPSGHTSTGKRSICTIPASRLCLKISLGRSPKSITMPSTSPIDAPFTEVNRVFFEFTARQEPYAERLLCAPGYREFADKLFLNTMIHNRTRHNPYAAFSREEQNIINTFLCVTSVNIYRQWVADKKRVPLERLIALSGTLLNNGVVSLF